MLRHLALVCCFLFALAVVFHPAAVRADWLQDLEDDAVAWMAEQGSPGMAIAIVKNDAAIYLKGFGRLSVDSSSPAVDADTVFLIGSTSKAFCSAQIAVLADQHKLAWNDPVRKHLSSFRMSDPWVDAQFQVEDLLCHRSGLHMFSLTMMEVLEYSTTARLRGIRFQPPFSSFRSAFAYQNCMYIAAAKLVEAVTGQSWGDNLTASIFTPLGMTRSVTTQAAVNQMKNVAPGHLRLDNGSLWPIPRNWFWNSTQTKSLAAGGVRTTAHDLGQWLRFHLSQGKLGTQRIVSEANMRYLHAPMVLEAPWEHNPGSPYWGPVAYCAGAWQYWGLSPQPFLFHDGGAMGSGSAIGFAPGAGIGIAVISNVEAGDGLAARIVWRFYDLYFGRDVSKAQVEQQVLKMRQRSRPAPAPALRLAADRAPDLPLESYCGVYHNPAYGDFVVSQADRKLWITMGPQQFRAELAPAASGGNAFLAYLPGYPAGYEFTIPMTFEFPASGPVKLFTGPIMHDPQEEFTRTGN
ncbi:MAG: serine hydrolase [Deltaproteobacteria bacterium]|nr:MAG: serine hydrolase [Deltaproteobacteria bacterium]